MTPCFPWGGETRRCVGDAPCLCSDDHVERVGEGALHGLGLLPYV